MKNKKVGINIDVEHVFHCILQYYVKHKCKWVEVVDILKLINQICGEKIVPETKYHFFKRFKIGTQATFHMICKNKNCLHTTMILVKNETNSFKCQRCKTKNVLKDKKKKVGFVTFSIKDQLEEILNRYKDSLIFPEEKDQFPIKDVWDGNLHREIFHKEKRPFISLTINTDGMQIFNSVSTSLWPIIVSVNNLPLTERFKLDNLIICGFHYKKAINMSTYLKTFILELRSINLLGGLETKMGKLKVFAPLCALDSPAKCKVQNHFQFNGYFGCSYCYERGIAVKKTVKYPNT